jgi:hypothetical protein
MITLFLIYQTRRLIKQYKQKRSLALAATNGSISF